MNKKLNFYCSTMLVIMFGVMAYTLYATGEVFVRAWVESDIVSKAKEKAIEDKNYARSAEYKQIMEHESNMELRGSMANIMLGADFHSGPILLKNEKTGKQEQVWISNLAVSYKMPGTLRLIKSILFLCLFPLFILMLVYGIKLILRFRNSENIFSLDNLKYIKKLAFTTLVFYICFWISTLMEVYYASQTFELAGRTVDYLGSVEMPNGLFEVPLLFIIYEVFAIGVRMREENQLTV